eukprot:m.205605 g.205605  ORF g.205605 m.205605 type:complete len:610 (+) comp39661_c0_seq12:637-2466(+)
MRALKYYRAHCPCALPLVMDVDSEILQLEGNGGSLEDALDAMIARSRDEKNYKEKLVASGVLKRCKDLFVNRKEMALKVSALIAELAKEECLRLPACQSGVIVQLVSLVDPSSAVDVVVNCLRAIANLCFDCDGSRNAVLQAGGPDNLCVTFSHFLSSPFDDDEGQSLIRVFAGTVLNLSNENEELATALRKAGVLTSLVTALRQTKENGQLMVLDALETITETNEAKQEFLNCSNLADFQTFLTDDFPNCSPALQLRVIQMLSRLAEDDDSWKKEIGRNDVLISHLVRQVEDKREVACCRKDASELLSIVLTDDESMRNLFKGGQGSLVRQAFQWLHSNDHELQKSGAFLVGNFCRNDENCSLLFEMEVVKKLVHISIERPKDENVQFAVLSALRNLSLPAALKPKLVDCDVIKTAIVQLNTDSLPVQFKALGILRLLTIGQGTVAKSLGGDKSLLDKVVQLSHSDIHAGVKAEACRLIATLVKACTDNKDSLEYFLDSGCLSAIVFLIQSQHEVMMNSGLVSLTLLTVSLPSQISKMDAHKEAVKKACEIAKATELRPEIRENAWTLLKAIHEADGLNKEELEKVIAAFKEENSEFSKSRLESFCFK